MYEGRPFVRIDDVDGLDPFLMAVVSGGDRWLFAASTGGICLGRRDPEGALFPYETDDRLLAADGTVGARTVIFADGPAGLARWEPHLRAADGQYRVTRSLWKSVMGDELWQEERNEDLGLTLRSGWASGDQFGFVRRVHLINESEHRIRARLLDGLVSILPACVDPRMQMEYSTLVDAYKQGEVEPDAGVALFRLSSIPTDRAIPNEALLTNVAWVRGLPNSELLLSTRQLGAFRQGDPVEAEYSTRAEPGALLACAEVELAPGQQLSWVFGLDGPLDARQVHELQAALGDQLDLSPELQARLDADVEEDRARLSEHVAAADGLQVSADPFEDARHTANTLFNCLRGGTFLSNGLIQLTDLTRHLEQVAPAVAARVSTAEWPRELTRAAMVERAASTGDRDLERLVREFLPLAFSRRHGDPSRPWNHFTVAKHPDSGYLRVHYEGNWRDVFQNWEALLHSYPDYCEAAVVKFVNASTIDGFNPYRISSEGFEWEAPSPGNPWNHIGYWNDHQVVYLQRLIDLAERVQPGSLGALLRRPVFVYADVPYRLASYEELRSDPFETITYDNWRANSANERTAQHGNEGRLRASPADDSAHQYATLAEKLLVPILSKMSHFIPGAGIWMNTQRPEWNDANNALVGNGVSMVTAAYLCRHVSSVRALLAEAGEEPFTIDGHVARHLRATDAALTTAEPSQLMDLTPQQVRAVIDLLGAAGSTYRAAAYSRDRAELEAVEPAELIAVLDVVEAWLGATVQANRRGDGLFHAYNLMQFTEDGVEVQRLQLMLEGQVAALASGVLTSAEAADLLDALRSSPLRREDIGSYLLYPDRELPVFMEKAVIAAEDVDSSPLLTSLLESGDRAIVIRDATGTVRFAPGLRSREQLDLELEKAGRDPRFSELVGSGGERAREVYEAVFGHRSFTGRSGAFFKYEGLGCVYWHMVSKLRVAALEVWSEAAAAGASPDVLARISAHHADIRAGLGVGSDPADYGAFPSDPYSHTPADGGAQQPGMTGQVKEDLIARGIELGIRFQSGRLSFAPPLASAADLTQEEITARVGNAEAIKVPAGCLAFSVAGTPVFLRPDAKLRATMTWRDGTQEEVPGASLSIEQTSALFERSSQVSHIEVFAPFQGADA